MCSSDDQPRARARRSALVETWSNERSRVARSRIGEPSARRSSIGRIGSPSKSTRTKPPGVRRICPRWRSPWIRVRSGDTVGRSRSARRSRIAGAQRTRSAPGPGVGVAQEPERRVETGLGGDPPGPEVVGGRLARSEVLEVAGIGQGGVELGQDRARAPRRPRWRTRGRRPPAPRPTRPAVRRSSRRRPRRRGRAPRASRSWTTRPSGPTCSAAPARAGTSREPRSSAR